ncbi:hypothetical protein JW964_03545 [candidate division KSB1 bacterium]|nr:hypothetical protein [candidate division KSB1 bacterium]
MKKTPCDDSFQVFSHSLQVNAFLPDARNPLPKPIKIRGSKSQSKVPGTLVRLIQSLSTLLKNTRPKIAITPNPP